MFTRNYIRIFSDIIVSDFATLDKDFQNIIGQEIINGNREDFSLLEYDFMSVAMCDGYDDVKVYLEIDASEDLKYYLRRLAFTLGRELKDEYFETASLKQILVSSLSAGLEGLDDLITEDDRANNRYLDPNTDDIGVSVLLLALLVETMTLSLENFNEPKKSAGSDSA